MTAGHGAVTQKETILKTIAIAACSVIALAGCATAPPANVVELTIYSQPAGAYITEKKTGSGFVAPMTLRYSLESTSKDSNGCLRINGFDARWPSGASVSTNDVATLCPPKRQFHHTFNRPSAAPGLDKDLAHANMLTQQQEARDRATADAVAAGLAAAANGWAAGKQSQQRMAPVTCTSRKTFNQVETNCY